MSASVSVDVQIASGVANIPDSAQIRGWIQHALTFSRPDERSSFEMAVRIVDEAEGQALNRQYRDTDKPTNVLAFPAGDEFAASRGPAEPIQLGDLVVCGPIVLREAAEQAKSVETHWCHLLVHGTLHLLGYDHENESQAVEMESLETRILAAHGIDDPYRIR
jgi:probable rRNA maturation factor